MLVKLIFYFTHTHTHIYIYEQYGEQNGKPERSETGTFRSNQKTRTATGTVLTAMHIMSEA